MNFNLCRCNTEKNLNISNGTVSLTSIKCVNLCHVSKSAFDIDSVDAWCLTVNYSYFMSLFKTLLMRNVSRHFDSELSVLKGWPKSNDINLHNMNTNSQVLYSI